MRIVQDGNGWALVTDSGFEVSRRSTKAEMREHLDETGGFASARIVNEWVQRARRGNHKLKLVKGEGISHLWEG